MGGMTGCSRSSGPAQVASFHGPFKCSIKANASSSVSGTVGLCRRPAVVEASVDYLFFRASSRDQGASVCSRPETVLGKQYSCGQTVNHGCFRGPVLYAWNPGVARAPYAWPVPSPKRNLKVKIQGCSAENLGEAQSHRKQQIRRKSSAGVGRRSAPWAPPLLSTSVFSHLVQA